MLNMIYTTWFLFFSEMTLAYFFEKLRVSKNPTDLCWLEPRPWFRQARTASQISTLDQGWGDPRELVRSGVSGIPNHLIYIDLELPFFNHGDRFIVVLLQLCRGWMNHDMNCRIVIGVWCVWDKLYTCNFIDMLQCLLIFVVYMVCTFQRSMSRSS